MSSTVQIQIKKEYFDLVPRPTKEDYNSLKNSIKEDGLHLPIIINQNGIILDGYTRYQICQNLGMEPIHEIKIFHDPYEEKKFVVITNLSRRHLNLFQKAEILKIWWIEQREVGFKTRGNNTWKTRRGMKYNPKERLNMRVAKMLGCSHNTACEMLYLLRKADKKTINMLRNGTIQIRTAYRNVKSNQNEKISITIPKRNYLRYPTCLRCKSETIQSINCHVHTEGCCSNPKCGWGWSPF